MYPHICIICTINKDSTRAVFLVISSPSPVVPAAAGGKRIFVKISAPRVQLLCLHETRRRQTFAAVFLVLNFTTGARSFRPVYARMNRTRLEVDCITYIIILHVCTHHYTAVGSRALGELGTFCSLGAILFSVTRTVCVKFLEVAHSRAAWQYLYCVKTIHFFPGNQRAVHNMESDFSNTFVPLKSYMRLFKCRKSYIPAFHCNSEFSQKHYVFLF